MKTIMKLSLTTPKKIQPHNDTIGAIAWGGCLNSQQLGDLPQKSRTELGAMDDVLNQATFDLWWGGLLTLDATGQDLGQNLSQSGIKSLHIITDPYLPPNIEGCTDDKKLHFQLGDMFVNLDIDMGSMTHAEFYLTMDSIIELKVEKQQNKNLITFDLKDPQVWIQLTKLTGPFEKNPQNFENLLKSILVSQLLDQIKKSFKGFEIPAIDLHSMIDSIPAGTNLQFVPESFERVPGYTVFSGHLE